MNILRKLAFPSVLAVAVALSTLSHADSDFVDGAAGTALSASADLDFQIIIPKFIRFDVGTAISGTIDTVGFDLSSTPATLGNGTDVAATAGIPVNLKSNGGTISLTGTTSGPLLGPNAQTVSFSEILSTSSSAQFNAPILADGATSAPVTVTPNVGTRVIDRNANWTFAYSNTNVLAAGVYEGRVTYTAALP